MGSVIPYLALLVFSEICNLREAMNLTRVGKRPRGLKRLVNVDLALSAISRIKSTISIKKMVNKLTSVKNPYVLNVNLIEQWRLKSDGLSNTVNWLDRSAQPSGQNFRFSRRDFNVKTNLPLDLQLLPSFHLQKAFTKSGKYCNEWNKAFSYVDLKKFNCKNAVACYYSIGTLQMVSQSSLSH